MSEAEIKQDVSEENITGIKTLLEAIRLRPGMYLGKKSLRALADFISGYSCACSIHQIEKDQHFEAIPHDFHDWVAYRCHFMESTTGWCNMILATSESEEKAFDRFFELIEEHKSRCATVIARLRNSRNTYSTRRDGEDVNIGFPDSIALITYTDDPGFFAISEVLDQTFPCEGFFPRLSWFHTFVSSEEDCFEVVDEEKFSRLRMMTDDDELSVDD